MQVSECKRQCGPCCQQSRNQCLLSYRFFKRRQTCKNPGIISHFTEPRGSRCWMPSGLHYISGSTESHSGWYWRHQSSASCSTNSGITKQRYWCCPCSGFWYTVWCKPNWNRRLRWNYEWRWTGSENTLFVPSRSRIFHPGLYSWHISRPLIWTLTWRIIQSLNQNVAAGHAVNNPSVLVSFPTDDSNASKITRIQAVLTTLQNLRGPGVGCPAASTTLLVSHLQPEFTYSFLFISL